MNKLSILSLKNSYLNGSSTPEQVIEELYLKIEQHADYNIWIHLEEKENVLKALAYQKSKLSQGIDLPLYGIPFAVKDNIDVAGLPTTAACPDFSYIAEETAVVVQKLLAAGAILIGKTNMDQFATGLVGTRSPYGVVKNTFKPEYISGGSSSGSAAAVALGIVAFSLGTDTAGSGRIPAGFNNLVGLKPSIDRINTKGLVPACKSLDCISIFSNNLEDASYAFEICVKQAQSIDNQIEQNRNLRIGIPHQSQLSFEESSGYERLFDQTKKKIVSGFSTKSISFDVFSETAKLLYHGPWVAERMAAIKSFYSTKSDKMNSVVRDIIGKADQYSATDTFESLYKLESLKKKANLIFEEIDLMVVPTALGIFTIDEVQKNPIELNTRLGYYTNFVNLLGLCAIAIPVGFNKEGLPFGITLIAPAYKDEQLAVWAKHISQQLAEENIAAENQEYVPLAVAGLHKRNQPLVHQLNDLMAEYSYTTTTSSNYRMYLVDPKGKMKPGVVRVDQKGAELEVEIWHIPARNLGYFLTKIPHPLGLGKVELADGTWVQGFICEGYIAQNSEDITEYFRWENFLADRTLSAV